jgi:hypothetical protein
VCESSVVSVDRRKIVIAIRCFLTHRPTEISYLLPLT